MAYKEVFRVEIAEVIRRWQAGESPRHIASGTGLSKDTVAKRLSQNDTYPRTSPFPKGDRGGLGPAQVRSFSFEIVSNTTAALTPTGTFCLKFSLVSLGSKTLAVTKRWDFKAFRHPCDHLRL